MREPFNDPLLTKGLGRNSRTETSYSGSDVIAIAYIPLSQSPFSPKGASYREGKRSMILGTLQTISITSTRSVTPVRVIGKASPIGYTRGGRTFAGTLVFATLDRDSLSEIYRTDPNHESFYDSTTSLFVDQMPPFNINITASNELGGISRQTIRGITLLNYGTVYSVDDVYTESTYTYVAEDVTPLRADNVSLGDKFIEARRTMSDILADTYGARFDPDIGRVTFSDEAIERDSKADELLGNLGFRL